MDFTGHCQTNEIDVSDVKDMGSNGCLLIMSQDYNMSNFAT